LEGCGSRILLLLLLLLLLLTMMMMLMALVVIDYDDAVIAAAVILTFSPQRFAIARARYVQLAVTSCSFVLAASQRACTHHCSKHSNSFT
jgi:hypothetical protein